MCVTGLFRAKVGWGFINVPFVGNKVDGELMSCLCQLFEIILLMYEHRHEENPWLTPIKGRCDVSDQSFNVVTTVGWICDQYIILYRTVFGRIVPHPVTVLLPIIHVGESQISQMPCDLSVTVVWIIDGQFIRIVSCPTRVGLKDGKNMLIGIEWRLAMIVRVYLEWEGYCDVVSWDTRGQRSCVPPEYVVMQAKPEQNRRNKRKKVED